MKELHNGEDIIDSRDIIERIEELNDQDELDNEEKVELESLESLAAQAEDCTSDWTYGEALIRESYFTEYCEELCKDIGELPSELPWYIANHIDWDGVAREIQADYSEVDFDGVSYLIRNS